MNKGIVVYSLIYYDPACEAFSFFEDSLTLFDWIVGDLRLRSPLCWLASSRSRYRSGGGLEISSCCELW
jgi:hypothetical protein